MLWISHVVRSMTSFVEKFRVYSQHIQNVIADTLNHCDKATSEGTRRQMVEAEVFRKFALTFWVLQRISV